jgi:hypothetical protein
MWNIRLLASSLFVFLPGCGAAPTAAPVAHMDETKSVAYREAVTQLAAMNREAESDYKSGKSDLAAKIMEQEKPLVSRVLSPPQPSLEAVEAASDLDNLYGTMLLHNKHYGWARVMFQGNLARWKHWRPITEDSTRRLKEAEAAIEECDKGILQ